MTVINENGVEINYETAVELMEDDLREELVAELGPCTEQEFFRAYEILYAEEYGELWELSKENPVY